MNKVLRRRFFHPALYMAGTEEGDVICYLRQLMEGDLVMKAEADKIADEEGVLVEACEYVDPSRGIERDNDEGCVKDLLEIEM